MKKFKKRTKEEKRSLILKIVSIVCFSVALFLVALTYFVTLPQIQSRIIVIEDWFNKIEFSTSDEAKGSLMNYEQIG